MGHVSSPADSHLPALALPRMDRSHRQQTPLSPRASPAWTGLTASRLPSPHARLPPHGQVSPPADSLSPRPPSPAWTDLTTSRLLSPRARPPPHGTGLTPADSSLPTLALPRMDRSHRQQTPLFPRPPSPAWTSLTASRLPLHRAAQSVSVRESVTESVYQPPSPAWTGLTASRLSSPHARLPRMGQVSPPADSPLSTLALPRMDRSHRPQTPQQKIRSLAASDSAICISEPHPN